MLKNKEYRLIVHDAMMAIKVIKALEQVNISNIRLTKTEYSKLEELNIELKGKAVEMAKRQATAMLAPLNQTVRKVIFISDSNTNILRYLGSNSALNTLKTSNYTAFGSDKIEIIERKIPVAVTVFFEIL